MDTKIKSPKPLSRPRQRAGRPWSGADISRLVVMAERQMPADRIALKLQRSESAVRAEAIRQRVKLAPTVKRPYGGLGLGAANSSRGWAADSRRRSGSRDVASKMAVSANASTSATVTGRGSRARSRDHSRGTESLF